MATSTLVESKKLSSIEDSAPIKDADLGDSVKIQPWDLNF